VTYRSLIVVALFFTLILSHIILGILSILVFSQFLGEHREKIQPVNYPNNRGGWDIGNDWAHVILAVFGNLVLMVCDILVNDPANYPHRFTKAYRESITGIGFVLGLVSLGCLGCAYLDITAVSAYTGCTGCDRAEYIATCLFDVFSFLSCLTSALAMVAFGQNTPTRLADEDVQAQELLKNNLKAHKVEGLPDNVVAVIAVPAPCCGVLVAISQVEAHRAVCEAKAALEAAKALAEKEERRKKRTMKGKSSLSFDDAVVEEHEQKEDIQVVVALEKRAAALPKS